MPDHYIDRDWKDTIVEWIKHLVERYKIWRKDDEIADDIYKMW